MTEVVPLRVPWAGGFEPGWEERTAPPTPGFAELRGVSVDEPRGAHLSGIDLTLRPGLTALAGPSHAGGATVLRLLAGHHRPRQGTVRVLGGDPRRASVRSQIGYCPAGPAEPEDVSAVDLLCHLARTFGSRRRDAPDHADEALRAVGLGGCSHQLVAALSGGQRRRVAIAAALVHHPRVVLLEDPMSGLDPDARRGLLDLLRSLSGDGRVSVVLTTTEGDEVGWVDHLVLLDGGRVGRSTADDHPKGAVVAVLDHDAGHVASALVAAGVAAVAAGSSVRLEGSTVALEVLQRTLLDQGVGLRSLAPTS